MIIVRWSKGDEVYWRVLEGGHDFYFNEKCLEEMRGWLLDCSWKDLTSEEVLDLTPQQIIEGVCRHYEGGMLSFMINYIAS